MPFGVFYALAAYASYAFGDAITKGFGTSLSIFQIIFWATLFSSIPVILTRPKSERLRDVFKSTRPVHLHIRAILGLIASLSVVYAFTHIPLAEAYALVFLAPAFATILAVIFLKEEMTPRRWVGLVLGFAGVLLVVRPGFRELQLGHVAAVLCAVFSSAAAVILRHVSQTEKRITIVGYSVAYGLALNGTVILISQGLVLPTGTQLFHLLAIGLLGGTGHVLIITATKNAPAAWVAQTQYSQIVWAIVLGAIFYSEFPGPFTLAGLAIVALAGLINFTPERARTWFGAQVLILRRKRPASRSAQTTPQPGKTNV